MPHSKIRHEIFVFANEMGYFPTDRQVEEIRRRFEALFIAHAKSHPGLSLNIGDKDYDAMMWDSIETVMRQG